RRAPGTAAAPARNYGSRCRAWRSLDSLLALLATLRHEEQRRHHRPEDRAREGPDEDRPARKGVACAEPNDQHRRLGGEQDEGDVQRLQHGTEPEDTPRKPHGE